MLGEGIEQLYVFAVFSVLGLALCAVYVFSMGLLRNKLATVIFDCIFGAFGIYAVCAVNLAVNNGQFRIFVFLGLALGCIICVATCKTLLDKVSSALYNLFTSVSQEEDNGSRVSQQKISNTDSGGDNDSFAAGVHAVGNSHANDGVKSTRRNAKSANKAAVRQRSRAKRSAGIYENGRVRKTLGGKQRTHVRRRYSVDSKSSKRQINRSSRI